MEESTSINESKKMIPVKDVTGMILAIRKYFHPLEKIMIGLKSGHFINGSLTKMGTSGTLILDMGNSKDQEVAYKDIDQIENSGMIISYNKVNESVMSEVVGMLTDVEYKDGAVIEAEDDEDEKDKDKE